MGLDCEGRRPTTRPIDDSAERLRREQEERDRAERQRQEDDRKRLAAEEEERRKEQAFIRDRDEGVQSLKNRSAADSGLKEASSESGLKGTSPATGLKGGESGSGPRAARAQGPATAPLRSLPKVRSRAELAELAKDPFLAKQKAVRQKNFFDYQTPVFGWLGDYSLAARERLARFQKRVRDFLWRSASDKAKDEARARSKSLIGDHMPGSKGLIQRAEQTQGERDFVKEYLLNREKNFEQAATKAVTDPDTDPDAALDRETGEKRKLDAEVRGKNIRQYMDHERE